MKIEIEKPEIRCITPSKKVFQNKHGTIAIIAQSNSNIFSVYCLEEIEYCQHSLNRYSEKTFKSVIDAENYIINEGYQPLPPRTKITLTFQ